jgi:hypothetical protein
MSRSGRVLVVAAVAAVVLVLLFPFSGTLDEPQRHWSVLGNRVPTDNPLLSLGAAVVAAAAVWVLTRPRHRGR